MNRPAYSPDSSPMEQHWDELDRRVSNCNPTPPFPVNLQDLSQLLLADGKQYIFYFFKLGFNVHIQSNLL